MKRPVRTLGLLLLAAAIVGAIVYAFLPRPVEVQTAAAARGPMELTVTEDGRTRVRERYTVSAPLSGRLVRIALKAGHPVHAGETVLASIEPTDPALLDPRARAEAQARVHAAEAALAKAEPALAAAQAAREFAQTELKRLREARASQVGGAIELEAAVMREQTASAEVRAAEFARDIARFELELTRAALLRSTPDSPGGEQRLDIVSPVNGRVLRVYQESAGVVAPGAALLEIGDERDLEVVVDVLTQDAVRIRPGDPARLEHWGGPGASPIPAVVRLVEPSGFTKISALGVEEQRVNIILDFPPGSPPPEGLGDAFRVEATVVTWRDAGVLQIPIGALFRAGEDWAVFTVESGRARTRVLKLGNRTDQAAQVLSGLAEGEPVVVHPSDAVRDGRRVRDPSAPGPGAPYR